MIRSLLVRSWREDCPLISTTPCVTRSDIARWAVLMKTRQACVSQRFQRFHPSTASLLARHPTNHDSDQGVSSLWGSIFGHIGVEIGNLVEHSSACLGF